MTPKLKLTKKSVAVLDTWYIKPGTFKTELNFKTKPN